MRLTGLAGLVLAFSLTVPAGAAMAKQAPAEQAPDALTVASWNVENFFDADDDPANPGDDEFTSGSWRRWDKRRYGVKISRLAELISQMKPDILCLVEVENRRVLEDLQKELKSRYRFELPYIHHRESGDPRGIDVAVLAKYQAATRWVNTTYVQTNFAEKVVSATTNAQGRVRRRYAKTDEIESVTTNQTRDVLICDFLFGGKKDGALHLIVNHWKSQLGDPAETRGRREEEASRVREEIRKLLKSNPAAAVLVTGDFNDNVDAPVLTETAGFSLDKAAVTAPENKGKDLLYNLSGGLAERERGTYFYWANKSWESIDCMCVSRGMLEEVKPAAPWRVDPASYGRFRYIKHVWDFSVATNDLKRCDGAPISFWKNRSKLLAEHPHNWNEAGFSDHFPIRVRLNRTRKEK